eukprot:1432741-Pleurochrysis_carterae.AAC.1
MRAHTHGAHVMPGACARFVASFVRASRPRERVPAHARTLVHAIQTSVCLRQERNESKDSSSVSTLWRAHPRPSS